MAFPWNSLMLVYDSDGDEAAAPVKHNSFGRRIQRDGPWMRGRQQRIHQSRAVAAALSGFRDDDHPGGGMGLAVRPPERGPDHHAGTL
jgi:hypothetical protein